MDESKSVIKEEFDRSGQYDAGLRSLVKSLQWAFGFLLVVIIGMLIYFFTAGGYFTVEPQNAVIVLKFGKYEQVFTAGGHWFLPYPVNRWVTVTTNQQKLAVNFLPAETPDGAPMQALEPGRDSYLMTGDANIIHASWTVNYHVSNPVRYYEAVATPANPSASDDTETDVNGFVGTRGPQTLIRNLFRQAVIRVTAERKVDDMLYARQTSYADAVQSEFARLLAEADCGVEADYVALERVFPPLKTKAAFDEVAAATNTSDSERNKARQYAVQVRNSMLTEEAELIAGAETYKTMVVSEMKAESTYFRTINEQYTQNPRTVLMALYNNMLAEVLQNQQGKFILGTGNGPDAKKKLWLKLNRMPKRRAAQPAVEGEN